ncbi:hypothetical protein D3C73_808650 [compost metagenome]
MHVARNRVGQPGGKTHDGLFMVLVRKRRAPWLIEQRRDRNRRVLHQVGAHSRTISHQGNPQGRQIVRRADAAAQQHRRTMNGPGADDHLARLQRFEGTLGVDDPGTCRTATLDHHAIHHAMGADGQVLAPAHLVSQVADRRGNALTLFADTNGADEHALLPWAVLVGLVRQPFSAQDLHHAFDEGRQAPGWRTPNPHRASAAMQRLVLRGTEIGVVFQLAKVRQARLPAPALRAQGLPFVIVGRRATVGHQRIDRRATTEDPCLLVTPRGSGAIAHHRSQALPDIAHIQIGTPGVAGANLGRHAVPRDIAPRLDQAHLFVGVFREPGGEHAARRPTAQDQVIDHDDTQPY